MKENELVPELPLLNMIWSFILIPVWPSSSELMLDLDRFDIVVPFWFLLNIISQLLSQNYLIWLDPYLNFIAVFVIVCDAAIFYGNPALNSVFHRCFSACKTEEAVTLLKSLRKYSVSAQDLRLLQLKDLRFVLCWIFSVILLWNTAKFIYRFITFWGLWLNISLLHQFSIERLLECEGLRQPIFPKLQIELIKWALESNELQLWRAFLKSFVFIIFFSCLTAVRLMFILCWIFRATLLYSCELELAMNRDSPSSLLPPPLPLFFPLPAFWGLNIPHLWWSANERFLEYVPLNSHLFTNSKRID